ncbi:MAG: hypothetical protein A2W90_23775 [Bacteroidetes bacterium GWF2_42_66]|nr:MAG: hypothetical protein A2W92_16495 [Bacteroidetes bacterium GWA2_42_15]OFY00292.1 MAG: hypothetical protein A2W89_13890 [Bacteroidetes bacterium GWE2_42_39]OFY47137.1 MAG: hypothetical protein A2W90_23775 [Bacteroidetes bacterium GWF2_42_66]HAZ02165.1 RNA polymerase sigma-70 factor [Marinilabiliales bacterium]HBL76681.1 RNA polymerase sigma-70 factor [Prolixibacteraceae bacterium]
MDVSAKYDIVRLKTGDRSEYEKIYHEFFDVLYSLSKQYLMNTDDAEEIVQDAFLKLWEIRSGLNDQSNIKNFLYTLVKNNCLNQLRNKQNAARLIKNYHYQELQYNYEALTKTSENYIQFQELKEKIDLAISELPDDLQVVFEMNRFQDMRYKDIALKLDLSEKAVEARMSKALKILRTELKDYLPVIYLVSKLLNE